MGYLVSGSWQPSHFKAWAWSWTKKLLATFTSSAPPLPQDTMQAVKIVGWGFCVWVGVQVSHSLACIISFYTKEIKHKNEGSKPNQLHPAMVNELWGCCLSNEAWLSIFKQRPSILTSAWVVNRSSKGPPQPTTQPTITQSVKALPIQTPYPPLGESSLVTTR